MTISISDIVSVQPGVLGTGGSPLALNGVFLTKNSLIPSNTVQSFSSTDSVTLYLGSDSTEEITVSETYFSGFDGSTIKPGTIMFAPYESEDREAFIRSGTFTEIEFSDIQAITGTLSIVVDGYTHATNSIDLSSASSESVIASTLQTALNADLDDLSTITGSVASDVLTVTNVAEGVIAEGQHLYGGTVSTDTVILLQLTTTESDSSLGGKGTYQLDKTSTQTSTTLHTKPADVIVSWNPILECFFIKSGCSGDVSTISFATGTAAESLLLTSSTGAIPSQGTVADTPATAMNRLKGLTQNWVSFTTMWEPNLVNKKLFASWSNSQNNRYLYIAWDTDAQATVNGSSTCFGAVAKTLGYNGVTCVYNTRTLAAFLLGTIASIDFSRLNGRITAAFKTQSGMEPTVSDQQEATNLLANGYNFYGRYSTANDNFNFLYNGQMPGIWKWIDTYVNQVYLNSQFQLALISLLTSVKSIPYNPSGYALINAAMQDPIIAAKNFGAIRTGIQLSESQKAQLKNAAGVDISDAMTYAGYYVQILDPGVQVRGNRGTPVINFWYTDGGSVHKISLASINVM